VTTPGRALADLALALPRRVLEKAVEMAEALRLDVVVDPAHPGAARLRAACGHDLATTARSPLEDVFLELCQAYRLARPRVSTFVEGFEVDACWPEHRLIVETDGREHHGTRRGLRARPRARRRAHRARLAGRALHRPPGPLGA